MEGTGYVTSANHILIPRCSFACLSKPCIWCEHPRSFAVWVNWPTISSHNPKPFWSRLEDQNVWSVIPASQTHKRANPANRVATMPKTVKGLLSVLSPNALLQLQFQHHQIQPYSW